MSQNVYAHHNDSKGDILSWSRLDFRWGLKNVNIMQNPVRIVWSGSDLVSFGDAISLISHNIHDGRLDLPDSDNDWFSKWIDYLLKFTLLVVRIDFAQHLFCCSNVVEWSRYTSAPKCGTQRASAVRKGLTLGKLQRRLLTRVFCYRRVGFAI